jgi:hypothetical protein
MNKAQIDDGLNFGDEDFHDAENNEDVKFEVGMKYADDNRISSRHSDNQEANESVRELMTRGTELEEMAFGSVAK